MSMLAWSSRFWALRKTTRDLGKRRIRSALTILGIAVGVAGLVAIVSTARNLTRIQRERYANTSQADIIYWIWEAPANLVPLLEADARIVAAELRLTHITRWKPLPSATIGSWGDIELVGIEHLTQAQEPATRLNQFRLLEGHYPTVGEILLDVSAVRAREVRIGQEIAYRDPYGKERTLHVSGITQSPSYLSSSITKLDVGYVPAPFLRRMLRLTGSNQLLLKLRDPRETDAVIRHLERFFRRQRLQVGAPEVRDPDTFPGKRELDALVMVMFLFSALGLLLSAFLVINTLSATVTEQVAEIGILKAVGATEAQVLRLYLIESLLYGAVGSALGVGLGAALGWRLLVWIGTLGNTPVAFRLAPEGVLLGLVVGLGVTTISGLLPARWGARLPVKMALEAGGLMSGGIRADYGQSPIERQLARLKRLPPVAKMAIRNLARRRGRSLFTLCLIALATAGFVGAASTRESVNRAIAQVYATYYADAWIWFGQSVDVQFEDVLCALDGVYAAEGWLIADGVVGRSEARLWGMPAHTTLYREVMREGRWFRENEPDAVVLSSELADAQNLRVGDRVEIVYPASGAEQRARSFEVVGIAIDNTIFLGSKLAGKAFLPRATLGRLLRRQGVASFFALGLAGREPQIVDGILAQLEFTFGRLRPSVQPIYDEIAAARESSRLLTLALVAMLLLIGLIGALGITNTLTLNVLERRREIAVMRAVGATDGALIVAFLAEGIVLGGCGWGLGALLGYPVGRLFAQQMGRALFALDYVLSAGVLMASLIFTLSLGILSSLGPALAAAHVRASVALRYE